MPTRATAVIGAPCWIDLLTSDVERSRSFYSDLFGWTAGEPSEEFGGYFMFLNNGSPVAGGMGSSPDSVADANTWTISLATDDAAKTAETATANGATVHNDLVAVADLGVTATLVDPSGARLGVWQPGAFQGFSVIAESGYPGWFELHTRDYDGALSFYRDVFGWDTQVVSDVADFKYTIVVDGESQLAGVMEDNGLPDGVDARWDVYFGVDDTDAALAKVVELGGTIVMDPVDTPYGRLGIGTDPMGAKFSLVGPNEAPATTA
jgi:predicted enzyme related to lactoylglutathione lyase